MSVEQINELIEQEQWQELEHAWARAAGSGAALGELVGVLETLIELKQADLAEMLGWTYLAEHLETAPPAKAVAAVHAVLAVLGDSDDLRTEAEQIYRRAYPDHEHLDALLHASGISGEQSPRRALRTLDTCLSAAAGSYLVNMFEDRVLRVARFDPSGGQFELTDAGGQAHALSPLLLADDYQLAAETDFRVLRHFRGDELPELVTDDPAAALVGLCQAHGGRTDSDRIRKELSDRYFPTGHWGRWWTRARAASKRCPFLTLEGKNPVTVVHHPEGLSLEKEMAAAVGAALGPTELLAVLEQYVREAQRRNSPVDETFIAGIVDPLAAHARTPARGKPEEALAAALSLAVAGGLGVALPADPGPSAAEVLAGAKRPAEWVAGLVRDDFWPGALDALQQREDATDQLVGLLRLAPAGQIDHVAERLSAVGGDRQVAVAVGDALAEPVANLELLLWLWSGPGCPPENMPGKVELLGKVLDGLARIDNDIALDADWRRDGRQKIRAALSARDFEGYRQAIAEMDQGVASTFRTRISRTTGLAQAVREDMMRILRAAFGGLFVRATVEPWDDESTLWTTGDARKKRQEILTEIIEVKMPANEKAIGEALAHGDLRENSEYKFACEERNFLQARAGKLMDEMNRSRVILPENVPEDIVGIGSRVRLRRVDDDREVTVTFLGPWDTDLANRTYSYQTQLAKEFLGKGVGETGSLKIEGLEGEYRIEDLACGVEEEAANHEEHEE